MAIDDLERGVTEESSGLKRLRAAILKRFRYRVGPGVNIRAAYGSQQGGIEAENTAKHAWFRKHKVDGGEKHKGPELVGTEDLYTEAENEEACSRMWSIYISEAERYDKRLVESWMGDMDSMLIFSGLYSASLTAFLIESYKNLQRDPGEMTVVILSHISAQFAASANGAPEPVFPTDDFLPTKASLVCNVLWFLSLALSLTCALIATLVKQWARDFVHKTEMRPSPVRRARIFSFLYFGLKRFRMHVLVDAIPMLLHASLFFFFAGLIGFLLPVNHVLMYIMAGILFVFVLLYILITVLPLVWLDSPYRTPLSGLFWRSWQMICALKLKLTQETYNASVSHSSMTDVMEAASTESCSGRDERALEWTLVELTDDVELLPFVEAIPECIYGSKGFRRSNLHLFFHATQTARDQNFIGSRVESLLRNPGNPSHSQELQIARQITCLKAMWTLAIISKSIWTDMKAMPTPLTFTFSHAAREYIESTDRLDRHHRSSVLAALKYSRIIGTTLWLKHVDRLVSDPAISAKSLGHIARLLYTVPDIYPAETKFTKDRPMALLLNSLRTLGAIYIAPDTDWITSCRAALTTSTRRNWTEEYIQVLTVYMDSALKGSLCVPYEFDLTCKIIMAEIDKDAVLSEGEQLLITKIFENFPNRGDLLPKTSGIGDVDKLMKIAMVLFSFVTDIHLLRRSFRGIYWYIAGRQSDVAVAYVLGDCTIDDLLERITVDLLKQDTNLEIGLLRSRYSTILEAMQVIFRWQVLQGDQPIYKGGRQSDKLRQCATILLSFLGTEHHPSILSYPIKKMPFLILLLCLSSLSEDVDFPDHEMVHRLRTRRKDSYRSPWSQTLSRRDIEHNYISSVGQLICPPPRQDPPEWKQLEGFVRGQKLHERWAIHIICPISPTWQRKYAKVILECIQSKHAEYKDSSLEFAWSLVSDMRWIDDVESASIIAQAWVEYWRSGRNMPAGAMREVHRGFSYAIRNALSTLAENEDYGPIDIPDWDLDVQSWII